jgi:hypothetical protein
MGQIWGGGNERLPTNVGYGYFGSEASELKILQKKQQIAAVVW